VCCALLCVFSFFWALFLCYFFFLSLSLSPSASTIPTSTHHRPPPPNILSAKPPFSLLSQCWRYVCWDESLRREGYGWWVVGAGVCDVIGFLGVEEGKRRGMRRMGHTGGRRDTETVSGLYDKAKTFDGNRQVWHPALGKGCSLLLYYSTVHSNARMKPNRQSRHRA